MTRPAEIDNLLTTALYVEVGARNPRLRTKAEIVADLLAILEEGKELGIIESAFPRGVPTWTGPDSDAHTEECVSCHEELPPAKMRKCGHCAMWFCDHEGKACYDAHAARSRGERWE